MITALAAALLGLEGQHLMAVSGDAALAPGLGGGITARWAWCFHPYFGLTAGAAWHSIDAGHVGRGSVGVHYLFDDYEWVPWAAVSAEAAGDSAGPAFALDLALGLDWRFLPNGSVGLTASWHPTLVGQLGDLTAVGGRVAAWW